VVLGSDSGIRCEKKFQPEGWGATTRMNKRVGETTERLEKEAQEFIRYLNDEVVPAVRQHSTKALRVASQKLQELADYMEQHSKSDK
jgi:hypothetical protein